MPLAYEPPAPEVLAWVVRQVGAGATVTQVRPLPGGLTAFMDRITVEHATGGGSDVVLRRWPDDAEGGQVARESDALAAVSGSAVPAPELLARDDHGAEAGVRCTLTTALPGEPDLRPADPRSWRDQLATTQAAIHGLPGRPPTRWDGFPRTDGSLAWMPDRGLRDAALAAAGEPLGDDDVLVHGDYQHFNVLWTDGRLTGVVDWPMAGTGSRGADVGHCRLNLAVLFGAQAATDYLTAYEHAAGVCVDRRADLRALLCFHPGWERFIPRQVAGRAPVDTAGMRDRVTETIRLSVAALG